MVLACALVRLLMGRTVGSLRQYRQWCAAAPFHQAHGHGSRSHRLRDQRAYQRKAAFGSGRDVDKLARTGPVTL